MDGAGEAVIEVIERDDGFVNHGDPGRYFEQPESELPILRQARGRVLDIGCGAGRHLAVLQAQGADACGIDPSPGAVHICRERGLAVELGDLDRLPDGPFDTVLLLGGNLALLGSPEAATRRLEALASIAAPGALLLGSNLDPRRSDEPHHAAYHANNRRHGRPGGQLRLRLHHGPTVSEWFDYWLMNPVELETLIAPSPWQLVHLDGSGFYTVVLRLTTG
ncbi:class I SAM-dependent methyltransferase [Actinoplanes philippinensis]|uniref:class I SAM-dependent methyltransferase n=1 Tax=Actinoplanes philippinensis TaxID=35752 RepID=UPI0033F9BD91